MSRLENGCKMLLYMVWYNIVRATVSQQTPEKQGLVLMNNLSLVILV